MVDVCIVVFIRCLAELLYHFDITQTNYDSHHSKHLAVFYELQKEAKFTEI